MSVTYSETGSDYTYLDANNLPVGYDSSIPHIRHLAYYISQKTPSKKTRIVDVRVAIRPPKYDAVEDNKNFYKKTKAKNFQLMGAQSLYSSDSLYLTTSMLSLNRQTDWQRVEGQMCISPCYSDYQTIEAFNITGSPLYETGFFANINDSTNCYNLATTTGPGIIIRLIRTVVIGQITP